MAACNIIWHQMKNEMINRLNIFGTDCKITDVNEVFMRNVCRTILYLSSIYAVGNIVMTFTAFPPPSWQVMFLYVLYLHLCVFAQSVVCQFQVYYRNSCGTWAVKRASVTVVFSLT